eukprot:4923305-Prymnesium_polylepis.1
MCRDGPSGSGRLAKKGPPSPGPRLSKRCQSSRPRTRSSLTSRINPACEQRPAALPRKKSEKSERGMPK